MKRLVPHYLIYVQILALFRFIFQPKSYKGNTLLSFLINMILAIYIYGCFLNHVTLFIKYNKPVMVSLIDLGRIKLS